MTTILATTKQASGSTEIAAAPAAEWPLDAEYAQFSYAVSHDLQASLRAVRAYAHFLDETVLSKLDSQESELWCNLKEAADRMQLQLDGIQAYSRIRERGEVGDIQAMEALEGAIQDVEMVHGRLTSLEVPASWPALVGDGDHLRRVFTELLGNVAKHAGPNTPIRISLEEQENLVIRVDDTGPGVRSPDPQRLFGILKTYATATQGAGAGLAMVRRIVHNHGGYVAWIPLENGTRLEFTWPLEGGDACPA